MKDKFSNSSEFEVELNDLEKEIKELKEEFFKKEELFKLLIAFKEEQITNSDANSSNIAETNFKKFVKNEPEIYSFFRNIFYTDRGEIKRIFGTSAIGRLNYNPAEHFDIVDAKFKDLRKEIQDKEEMLVKKELIRMQKIEIIESKNNRESVERFTFVLAFGVIITLLFNWFEIFREFQNANRSHLMIMGGIFILIFTIMAFFLIHIMKMGKQIKSFISDLRFLPGLVIAIILIIILAIFLFTIPNNNINNSGDLTLQKEFKELKEIQSNNSEILNQILIEQININNKLIQYNPDI